jgi:hypothetical protein
MAIVFPPNSRYAGAVVITYVAPDGREISYVSRRVVPAPGRFTPLARHRLDEPTRIDLLSERYYGDPELYWRICDANLVFWPPDATITPRRELVIPLPLEVGKQGES